MKKLTAKEKRMKKLTANRDVRRATRRAFAAVSALLLAGAIGLFGCAGGVQEPEPEDETVELQVFAANSLSKALEDIQALYVQQNPGITFADTQYLGSGDLNAQLQAGAYADLLISASSGKMNDAADAGLVDSSTRFDLFVNDLVMVVAQDSDIQSLTLEDIASGKYTVAVGDDSVPAGNYANQALSTVGCFNDPEGKIGAESAGKANGADAYAGTPLEGKVNLQASAGNVCQQVAIDAVDVAFVYSSDVHRFEGVRVAGVVDGSLHKSIVYPGAVCSVSENAEAANAFLNWTVTDPEAIALWQSWGFEMAAS